MANQQSDYEKFLAARRKLQEAKKREKVQTEVKSSAPAQSVVAPSTPSHSGTEVKQPSAAAETPQNASPRIEDADSAQPKAQEPVERPEPASKIPHKQTPPRRSSSSKKKRKSSQKQPPTGAWHTPDEKDSSFFGRCDDEGNGNGGGVSKDLRHKVYEEMQKAARELDVYPGSPLGKLRMNDAMNAFLAAKLNDINNRHLSPFVRDLAMTYQAMHASDATIENLITQVKTASEQVQALKGRVSVEQRLVAVALMDRLGLRTENMWDMNQMIKADDIPFDDPVIDAIISAAVTKGREADHREHVRNQPNTRRG